MKNVMSSAVKSSAKGLYRASEFAALAGVSVRALHHYDHLGLLKPSGRTAAGYRLYGRSDFSKLEQIVVLKYLGLPLKQIKATLGRNGADLQRTLRAQGRALEEKRRCVDMAVQAIAEAERIFSEGREPDWEVFKNIIEVIEMQDTEWGMKYYNDEARAKVEERKKLWNPALQEQVTQDWAELTRDIEAALGEDPAGARGQALAARWRKLVEGFTGGDPQIAAGLNAMYADQKNWPSNSFQKPYSDEVEQFIYKAMAVRM